MQKQCLCYGREAFRELPEETIAKGACVSPLGEYTLVTLPRIVTPYRDSVDGTRDRVTYQKLVTR